MANTTRRSISHEEVRAGDWACGNGLEFKVCANAQHPWTYVMVPGQQSLFSVQQMVKLGFHFERDEPEAERVPEYAQALKRAGWVKCPICGGHSMPKYQEKEPEGDEGYIFCTNLACGSNGGDNFDACRPDPTPMRECPLEYCPMEGMQGDEWWPRAKARIEAGVRSRVGDEIIGAVIQIIEEERAKAQLAQEVPIFTEESHPELYRLMKNAMDEIEAGQTEPMDAPSPESPKGTARVCSFEYWPISEAPKDRELMLLVGLEPEDYEWKSGKWNPMIGWGWMENDTDMVHGWTYPELMQPKEEL